MDNNIGSTDKTTTMLFKRNGVNVKVYDNSHHVFKWGIAGEDYDTRYTKLVLKGTYVDKIKMPEGVDVYKHNVNGNTIWSEFTLEELNNITY